MAEYKEIHGTKIRNYTTNPDNPIVGEVWYNDTDNVLKFQYPDATTAGSWRTGNNFNTTGSSGRGDGTQGAQDAALAVAGNNGGYFANVESYNGTNWTEVNDLNTTRAFTATFGLNPATITAGGYGGTNVANVESFNGTN